MAHANTDHAPVEHGFLLSTSVRIVLSCLLTVSTGWTHTASASEARAIFAGGCFWCIEEVFEKIDGVSEVTSGDTGGSAPNPDYSQVSRGDNPLTTPRLSALYFSLSMRGLTKE